MREKTTGLHKPLAAALLTAVVVVGASGCSSSKSPAHTAAARHDQPAGTAAAPASSADASTPATSGVGGGSADVFCSEVKKQAHILTLGNYDLAHVNRGAYKTELSRITAVAPDVIKADVQSIVAIQYDLINGHYDPKKLDNPQLVQHTQHLATWMQTNCPGVLGNPTG